MSTITIRNVHEKTLRALKVRATQHGRSTEAEIRAILEDAVRPKIGLGTELAALGQRFGGIDLDIQRDPAPIDAAEFD